MYNIFEGRQRIPDAFEGILNPDHSKLKILTPEQILQRLPIALAQVKEDTNSESSLNEIRQLFILCISRNKSLKKYTIT